MEKFQCRQQLAPAAADQKRQTEALIQDRGAPATRRTRPSSSASAEHAFKKRDGSRWARCVLGAAKGRDCTNRDGIRREPFAEGGTAQTDPGRPFRTVPFFPSAVDLSFSHWSRARGTLLSGHFARFSPIRRLARRHPRHVVLALSPREHQNPPDFYLASRSINWISARFALFRSFSGT